MTHISSIFWTWLSFGFFIGVNSDAMGFLGTLYVKGGEAIYDGTAPKEIFAKSMSEIIVTVDRDSYVIRDFGSLRRITMKKKIKKMALIDKVGNTVYNRGSQTLYMNYKTREEYPIFTGDNYKTYQMALDIKRNRVFLISRPDKEPYGKVFAFDTAYTVIDSNNRVIMEELPEFGARVSAIAIESSSGSIVYSQVEDDRRWIMKLLFPLNTVNETLKAEQDERRGRKNNSFITTPKPKTTLKSDDVPDISNDIYDAKTETTTSYITTKVTKSNNDIKKTTTSRPTTTNQPPITTQQATICTPAVVSQPSGKARPTFEASLNAYTDGLIALYSQGSEERVKHLIVENKRLRHQLTMLADKHEYLLANANVFLTSVSLYSDSGEPDKDVYKNVFTLSVRKMKQELTDLIDQICPA